MEELQNEKFEKRIFTKHGGFVYLFHEPGDLTDDDAVKMDRYFEVLDGNEFKASNKKQQLLLKQGVIKDIDDDHKQWKLTYVEFKKKELEQLKNQLKNLKDAQIDHDNDNESKENENMNMHENDDKDKLRHWDEDKCGQWLNDNNMNELRVPFYTKNVNGDVLMNANKNKDGKLFEDMIKGLSKSELEAIVMRQFNDKLNELKQANESNNNNSKEMILRNKINELQVEIESIQDSKICLICYVNNKNILIKPCNHVCCCDGCIKEIQNCPLCDKRIHSTEKIYN